MNSDFEVLGGRDPHAVLGLKRGVSRQDVTRAFRRNAAQGGHPDMGGDERTFRQLTRARDILLDPRRLIAYNASRQAAGTVHSESHGARRTDVPPASFRQGRPDAPHGQADNGTRVAPAQTGRSSVAAVPAEMNAWAIITVMLVLLGPLLWPAAVVTGLLALRRMGKRAAAQP